MIDIFVAQRVPATYDRRIRIRIVIRILHALGPESEAGHDNHVLMVDHVLESCRHIVEILKADVEISTCTVRPRLT